MADRSEGCKRISFARMVALGFQKCLNEIRGVGNQRLRVLVDGGNSIDGVFANIDMPVFQARPRRRQQGLNELRFSQFA